MLRSPRYRTASRYPASRFDARQRRLLGETVAIAERLPGYKVALSELPDHLEPAEKLCRMPVLERADVQARPEAFVDPRRRAIALHTSGSTGVPLRLYLDRRARRRRRCQYALFFLCSGWRPWHRSLSIKVLSDPSARIGSALLDRTVLRARRIASVLKPIEEQYRLLRETDPEILHGLPSVLQELAARTQVDGWRPRRLKRIFTSSESLSPPARAPLEEVLGARVIDHYGAAEAFIGWECERRSGFHVNTANVVVEVLNDDGTSAAAGTVGRVVITTLDNPAMPLIRYAIGDLAVAGDGAPCRCGRPGPVLPRVIGREVPLFELRGIKVSPWGVVTRISELEFVSQFQIVQSGADAVLVRIHRRDGHPGFDGERIRAVIAQELGTGLDVKVEELDRPFQAHEPHPGKPLAAPSIAEADD